MSTLSGCVPYAKCREPSTRHQLGGHFHKGEFELVVLYLNLSDLVVKADWGLNAVVCRKVQQGIGRYGEQQQGVLKKPEPGSRIDQGGNKCQASSNCDTVHHLAKHPSGPSGTPPNFENGL